MPTNDPEYAKRYYQAHKEKWQKEEYRERRKQREPGRRQYHKDYYQQHKEHIAERNKKYRPADNERQKAKRQGPEGEYVRTYHKEWYRKNSIRARIINALGGKCVRCGFDDARALQVDHVNGEGRQEYAQFKNGYQRDKYILEHLDSENYQLLCANCNWIKRDEEQEHMWAYRKRSES